MCCIFKYYILIISKFHISSEQSSNRILFFSVWQEFHIHRWFCWKLLFNNNIFYDLKWFCCCVFKCYILIINIFHPISKLLPYLICMYIFLSLKGHFIHHSSLPKIFNTIIKRINLFTFAVTPPPVWMVINLSQKCNKSINSRLFAVNHGSPFTDFISLFHPCLQDLK